MTLELCTSRKGAGLIVHAISVQDSNLCGPDPSMSLKDRQTYKQMICNHNTALCTKVHRTLKKLAPFGDWYMQTSTSSCLNCTYCFGGRGQVNELREQDGWFQEKGSIRVTNVVWIGQHFVWVVAPTSAMGAAVPALRLSLPTAVRHKQNLANYHAKSGKKFARENRGPCSYWLNRQMVDVTTKLFHNSIIVTLYVYSMSLLQQETEKCNETEKIQFTTGKQQHVNWIWIKFTFVSKWCVYHFKNCCLAVAVNALTFYEKNGIWYSGKESVHWDARNRGQNVACPRK